MKTALIRILSAASLAFVLSLPARAEVILDDDFNGATLDSAIWSPWSWSTGTASVSESRLHLNSGTSIWANTGTNQNNFINVALYGVQSSGSDLSFGFIGAMGGWIQLTVAANGKTTMGLHWEWSPWEPPGHTTHGDEAIDIGTSSDGDFQFDWGVSLLCVVNNGQVLYYQDDPQHIPYYWGMGPFTLQTINGNVSVDRVVLTNPEPATLLLLAFGALFQGYVLKRSRVA